MRQGGHQVAVNSTSTGVGLVRTSPAKVASDVVGSVPAMGTLLSGGLAVDLGDEPFPRAGLLAALADEAGGDAAPATPVPVHDLGRGAGTLMALAPVRHRRQQ